MAAPTNPSRSYHGITYCCFELFFFVLLCSLFLFSVLLQRFSQCFFVRATAAVPLHVFLYSAPCIPVLLAAAHLCSLMWIPGPVALDRTASVHKFKVTLKVCHSVPCRPEVPTHLGVHSTPQRENCPGAPPHTGALPFCLIARLLLFPFVHMKYVCCSLVLVCFCCARSYPARVGYSSIVLLPLFAD